MRSCPIAIQFLPLAVLLAATASAPTSASGFSLLRPPRTSAISATCDARAFGGAVNHGIRFRFDGRRGNALLPSHARRDDAFDAAASSDAEGGIFRGGGTTTKTAIGKFATFAEKNFFLLGMVVAVTLARVFPSVSSVVLILCKTKVHFPAPYQASLRQFFIRVLLFRPASPTRSCFLGRNERGCSPPGTIYRKVWRHVHIPPFRSIPPTLRAR